MTSQKIIVNQNGVNTLSVLKDRSFAQFVFSGNLVETSLDLNVWVQFANPTGGLLEIVDSVGDFTPSVSNLSVTFTGNEGKWFNLSAVTNIYRGAAGAQTRTLELQWKLNGAFVGFARRSQSSEEANIYTGNGFIYLQNGDVLSPWVRNVENGDNCRLDNASFTLSQEIPFYYS